MTKWPIWLHIQRLVKSRTKYSMNQILLRNNRNVVPFISITIKDAWRSFTWEKKLTISEHFFQSQMSSLCVGKFLPWSHSQSPSLASMHLAEQEKQASGHRAVASPTYQCPGCAKEKAFAVWKRPGLCCERINRRKKGEIYIFLPNYTDRRRPSQKKRKNIVNQSKFGQDEMGKNTKKKESFIFWTKRPRLGFWGCLWRQMKSHLVGGFF